jgi:hypothetical protein
MIEIAWARRKSDGRIVGVDQVANGLACECVCSGCGRPVVAAQGDVNQHHFRHYADDSGSSCGGGQETALHLLAKTIVMEATSIQLPDGTREIVSAELEPTMGDVRPDVLIHTPEGRVAIEIAVEHRTGDAKIARLVNMALPAVEIDISVYRGALLSSEELREVVLLTAGRRWLKPRKEREKPPDQRKPKDWIRHHQGDAPVDWAAIDARLLKPADVSTPVPELEPAKVEAPAPATAFMHYCHCGRWGAFGYGVDLLKGEVGRWYCTEHRRELMNRIVVP